MDFDKIIKINQKEEKKEKKEINIAKREYDDKDKEIKNENQPKDNIINDNKNNNKNDEEEEKKKKKKK